MSGFWCAGNMANSDKKHYFAALDGYRGVLAVMVAIYHTMWQSHTNSLAFFNNGPVLIDLFFVFSGFLMFTLYDGRLSNGAQGREFIKRRFARLYPIHFVMLMIALLYASMRVLAHYFGFATLTPGEILPFQKGAQENLASFISNLTLTQSMGLHDSLSFNMPSWTVSVEFWTYFVFLGLMLWARPKKLWHFSVIALLVAVNYYILSRVKPNMDFHYDLGFFRCLGGFFTGVLVAASYRYLHNRSKPQPKNKTLLSLLEVFALGIMLGFVIYFPGRAQFFIAPVAFVFVLVFAFDGGFVSRIMASKPLTYLGRISYSIYMIHILISLIFAIIAEKIFPIIFGTDWNENKISGDLWLIPYIILVISVSHFSYKYVEIPGRKAIINTSWSEIKQRWKYNLGLAKRSNLG